MCKQLTSQIRKRSSISSLAKEELDIRKNVSGPQRAVRLSLEMLEC